MSAIAGKLVRGFSVRSKCTVVATSRLQYCLFTTESKAIPKIAGRKSTVIELKQYDEVWWCSCGYSKDQPFCDGSHETEETGMEPVEFIAPESKKYAFCTCKLSKKAPLCDGSHKSIKKDE
mmetsp:Transcript_12096/g.19395  ORF Transcript_12096/g.19395 Transcript_12096/m.19395 type:complete len:121 (+) Transcript_12096:35-397(+)